MDHAMDFHPVTAIEPSMQRISGRNNTGQSQQSKGFFPKFFNSFFNSMVSTISVTVTNVFTRKIHLSNLSCTKSKIVSFQTPVTSSRTTINTISFVIMSCTPSPLMYTICPSSSTFRHPTVGYDERKRIPFVTYSILTRTSTITALVVSSTVALCAQLVNVTGPCRLRRGLWIDDPIVLSFDDDMDTIDEAFSPSQTLR
jgi:hypothetical protein